MKIAIAFFKRFPYADSRSHFFTFAKWKKLFFWLDRQKVVVETKCCVFLGYAWRITRLV